MSLTAAPPVRRTVLVLRFLVLSILLTCGGLATVATAGEIPVLDPGDNYDARGAFEPSAPLAPTAAQRTAMAVLREAGVDLAVTHDPVRGVTRGVYHRTGFLTPAQEGDALDLALAYVAENLPLLGLEAHDLATLEVTDRVYSRVSGATHLYLRQTWGGLPVLDAQLHVNINREGRVVSVNNALLPDLEEAVADAVPRVSAVEAVLAAARRSGLGASSSRVSSVSVLESATGPRQRTVLEALALSHRDVTAELAWLPIRRSEARLVWSFQLALPGRDHAWDFTVDAHTGEIWTRVDWVSAADYRAFEQPVESPNHSPAPPPADGRVLVVDPEDTTASPLGWHDDGTTDFTILRGNNVHAFEDADGNGLPPAVEPDCGAGLVCDFDFPIDFGTADPVDYTAASITNLFYWSNLVHDVQYHYGFDEAAGNFQNDNLGNGGVGGDPVLAMGQSSGGPCPNNAFFATAPDGAPGEMVICLFVSSNPRRDIAWDAGVVVHEYGHGIANRLVGGPSNTSCLGNLQRPMEGLADWWGLVYTHEPGDAGTDARGIGTYFIGEPIDGGGIRVLPYSTDPAVNDHTYASITGLSVPYGVGAVWAQAAWEVYWALIDHHGFDPNLYDALGGSGNQRMMLYVNEGLKNTACNPTFTDVRDGIVQAAIDNYGGEDVCRVWEAFAAFGLGVDADGATGSSLAVTDGFAVPESCNGAIFFDGFESGGVASWSSSVGGS